MYTVTSPYMLAYTVTDTVNCMLTYTLLYNRSHTVSNLNRIFSTKIGLQTVFPKRYDLECTFLVQKMSFPRYCTTFP